MSSLLRFFFYVYLVALLVLIIFNRFGYTHVEFNIDDVLLTSILIFAYHNSKYSDTNQE